MKKFTFLIPVAAAAAALSGQVHAKVEAHPSTTEATKAITIDSAAMSGVTESFYVKDGERHSLMMKPSASGQMLAYHNSHASHASHASHSSHYSHRSGY